MSWNEKRTIFKVENFTFKKNNNIKYCTNTKRLTENIKALRFIYKMSVEPGERYTVEQKIQSDVYNVRFINHTTNTKLNFSEALRLLSEEKNFRQLVAKALSESPHNAFYWEFPPITHESAMSRHFEFVTLNAPSLEAISPDPEPFRNFLKTPNNKESAVVFENLGRDAILIAPRILTKDIGIYSHMAAFVRNAPNNQVDDLFKFIGKTMKNTLEKEKDRPIWLSTCGTGVSWLHIRLDRWPKYYSYIPFKTEFKY